MELVGAFDIERLARGTSAGRADRRFDRQLAAAERVRSTGRIRILVGIERVAPAPARRDHGLLDDRRWSGDLLAVTRLRLRRTIGGVQVRIRLRRGKRRDVRLGYRRLTAGPRLRAAQHPQSLLKHLVLVLQLFVLTGELPQLVLKLLNPHLRIAIVGLCECRRRQHLRSKRQRRRERQDAHDPAGHSADGSMTSGRHVGLTTRSA